MTNITWKFNIATASWTGGFFKRLINSLCRKLSKKTIGCTTLRYDELQTVISEVELTINSRPLDYIYDENCEEIITPNHLFYGRNLSITNDDKASRRVKYVQLLIFHFWNRWRTEYLTSLRVYQSSKKIKQRRDNQIRAVKLFVGKNRTVIDRPINLLYLLEYDIENRFKASDTNDSVTKVAKQESNYRKLKESSLNRDLNFNIPKRPKRNAALVGKLKCKFLAGNVELSV